MPNFLLIRKIIIIEFLITVAVQKHSLEWDFIFWQTLHSYRFCCFIHKIRQHEAEGHGFHEHSCGMIAIKTSRDKKNGTHNIQTLVKNALGFHFYEQT